MTIDLLFVILMSLCLVTANNSTNTLTKRCPSDVLVSYKLIFTTFWDRDQFPRQYPEWRPQAHFSKQIGFSHNGNFSLFRVGETASEGLQQFAELGESDILESRKINSAKAGTNETVISNEIDDAPLPVEEATTTAATPIGENASILDGFTGPKIPQGVGTSTSALFVDGDHPLVSVVSKLQPSPDWFVGLDSLDLCGPSGHFIDTMTVEADPMDAGTDNGFTFTSPNWPTDPKAAIFKITNDYPSHPAGSFYYPEQSELPTIAMFTLVKEKEYQLTKVFKDGKLQEIKKARLAATASGQQVTEKGSQEAATTTQATSSTTPMPSTTVAKVTKSDKKNKEKATTVKKSTPKAGYYTSSGPKDFFKKRYSSGILKKAEQKINKIDLYKLFISDLEEGRQLQDSLSSVPLSRRRGGMGMKKKNRSRKLRHSHHNRHRGPRNCRVSEWGGWSSCSKSCGIGEASRTRRVVRHAKRGGRSCPALRSVKWCGSARNCRSKYFDW